MFYVNVALAQLKWPSYYVLVDKHKVYECVAIVRNRDAADINRKLAHIIEAVDQGKAELEHVRLASAVTIQSIALPVLFAHQSFSKLSQENYYIFSPDQSQLRTVHLHTLHEKLYKDVFTSV